MPLLGLSRVVLALRIALVGSPLLAVAPSSVGSRAVTQAPAPAPRVQVAPTEEVPFAALGTLFEDAIGSLGKTFDAKKGLLKNRILPFGFNAIIARIYKAPSWLDGKECIVLDYSDTSLVAQWIRDEIRQIGPRLYLGKVYWNQKRLMDFALKF